MAKLLLVDDDPVLLLLMTKLLENAGHAVTSVESAQACLDHTHTETFDLIITDVMMPDLDGYQLTMRLRDQATTRTTPILILTSRLQGPDEFLARAAGASDYDMKTVNGERLARKIIEVLAAPPPTPVVWPENRRTA